MLKEVFAPHLGKKIKFGRRRPSGLIPKLHFDKYVNHLVLPTPPASIDYSSVASKDLRNLYLNDELGNCVIAAGYHVVGVETANAGKEFIATNSQIIADYSAIGGYIPGHPNTDEGCNEQTALNYWTKKGFANGTKLTGWLAVNATNKTQVMQAIWLFENCFLGIDLPDKWINPFPSADGFIWDVGAPDPYNGHAVMGSGYSATGVKIDTWGLLGTITWAAISHLCVASTGGELYVLLTPDQINKATSKAPNGFDWVTLTQDFNALGGNVPVPTPPAPPIPVPPTPAPTTVTLAQAIAWATQGLTNNWPK